MYDKKFWKSLVRQTGTKNPAEATLVLLIHTGIERQ
jgi:hypothetical protein